MRNGTSSGQGSETTHGKRDVKRETADNSNRPELAGAKLAQSNGLGRSSYIGASNVGPSSSKVAVKF